MTTEGKIERPFAGLQDAALLRFLHAPGGGMQALAVYHVVNRLRHEQGANPSHATIARMLGIKRQRVTEAIRWLVSEGLISEDTSGKWQAVRLDPVDLSDTSADRTEIGTVQRASGTVQRAHGTACQRHGTACNDGTVYRAVTVIETGETYPPTPQDGGSDAVASPSLPGLDLGPEPERGPDLATKAGRRSAFPKPGDRRTAPTTYPPEFVAYWSAGPWRDGKAGAYTDWWRVVVQRGVEPAALVAAATAYAGSDKVRGGYVVNPSVWLRERLDDWLDGTASVDAAGIPTIDQMTQSQWDIYRQFAADLGHRVETPDDWRNLPATAQREVVQHAGY